MTAKVINDPAALGWEFDPDTGRWTWGGSEGGSNGGGGTPFPEAPINGLQYGRQNAGWTEIIHTDGGGDVDLTNYYTKPESDDKFQVKGNYLTEFTEEDPTVPAHVKSISTDDINKWNNPPTGGGGGGAVNSVNGKTGDVNLTYSDVGAQVAGSYATANHNHNGVYQPAGSYAASNHNHNGVYQPAGNYATTSYSYSKAESDGKYELKGAGGGFDGTYTGAQVSFTCSNTNTALSITAPNCGIKMAGSGSTGKYMRITSDSWQVLTGNYATTLMSVKDNGTVTAIDFIATSDRNKKDHIETAPTGVIEKLRGVTFQWKHSGENSSGVIAQELQDAGLGHLVHEGDEGLSVSYSGLTAYLIEEVKALRSEIEAMKR